MPRRRAVEAIAMLAATGALAGYLAAQFVPREYRSSMTVAFSQAVSDSRCQAAAAQTFADVTLRPVILESAYYKPELDYTPVDELVQRIQRNGSIHGVKSPDGEGFQDGFKVVFTDPDRYAALDMVRVLAEQMARSAGQSTRVAEPVRASLTGPGPGLCLLLGMSAGAAIGLAITAFARLQVRSTI